MPDAPLSSWERATTPHPCLDWCGMFVPWEDFNGCHYCREICNEDKNKKSWRLYIEAVRDRYETVFLEYGHPWNNFVPLKYLGRLLLSNDDDYPAVVANLRKSHKKRMKVSRIMGQEGDDEKRHRIFQSSSAVCCDIWFGNVDCVPLPPSGAWDIP